MADTGVGLLTWAIWLGGSGNLAWRTGYYSEVTTSAAGLLAWWALLRWREGGGRAWLVAVAVCIGWAADTRQLTAVVFAVPVAFVVLKEVGRRRSWGELAWGMLAGTLVLGLTPLWSAETTGSWRRSPRAAYTEAYMPWDRLGFGLDTTPATRPLPPELDALAGYFKDIHEAYTPAAAPAALLERARYAAGSAWSGWRLPLALFAVAGLFFLPPAGLVGLATLLLQLEAHAVYAHKATWAVYYLEVLPVAAFLSALGLSGLARRARGDDPGPESSRAWRSVVLAGVLGFAMVVLSIGDGARARRERLREARGSLALRQALAAIPEPRAMVFLRFSLRFDPYFNLVSNEPFLDRQRIWVVHDLGPRNAELVRAAPDRAPYLFDEESGRLSRLER